MYSSVAGFPFGRPTVLAAVKAGAQVSTTVRQNTLMRARNENQSRNTSPIGGFRLIQGCCALTTSTGQEVVDKAILPHSCEPISQSDHFCSVFCGAL
jgi:hypothetical protein